MEPITIAAVSCLIVHGNPTHNLAQIEKWTRLAAAEGADLILFNETSATGYWMSTQVRQLAEPLDGPIVQRLAALARELGVVIVAGMAEKADAKVHNTQVLVGPQGLIGTHRKSAFPSGEEKWFDIGNDRNVFEIRGWKMGVAICFESVHPETCRALANNGAQIILAPYMNGVTAEEIATGKRPYFNRRARENGVWYVANDQCGHNESLPDKPLRAGAACFVNPRGEIVATTSADEPGEHMLLYRIEPSTLPGAGVMNMRMMTFNIRYDNPGDAALGRGWADRREAVIAAIRNEVPDLFGLQEVQHHQLQDLAAAFPDYEWIGVGRDDGQQRGEFVPIFYLRERFACTEQGTFWLSETPEVPGSRSWDAAITRIATWGRFRETAHQDTFVLVNTHLDHAGPVSRLEAARLLRQRVARLAGSAPVLLVGDFNTTPDSAPYAALIAPVTDGEVGFRDARTGAARGHFGPDGTCPGFDLKKTEGSRVDYVFVDGAVDVEEHRVIDAPPGVPRPSDHRPVCVTLQLSRVR